MQPLTTVNFMLLHHDLLSVLDVDALLGCGRQSLALEVVARGIMLCHLRCCRIFDACRVYVSEIAWRARTTVYAGKSAVIGIFVTPCRACSPHETSTSPEHFTAFCNIARIPAAYVYSSQGLAVVEYGNHAGNIGCVKRTEV